MTEIEKPSPQDWAKFEFEKVINFDNSTKRITLVGSFTDREGKAIVVLEKTAFSDAEDFGWGSMMGSLENVTNTHDNDIYKKFKFLWANKDLNTVSSQVIFPAEPWLISKYSKSEFYLIKETPEFYKEKCLPWIEALPVAKKQWVWNILDLGYEAEKTFFRDDDPETGFVLVTDYGMDLNNVDSVHCLAITKRKDLQSLRDLGAKELPLLRKIRDVGYEKIPEKFGIKPDQMRVHFHYHPSFYHLHVHFTHANQEAASLKVERSHMLDTVIENISMVGDYYQKVSLEFALRDGEPLYKHIHGSG